MLLVMFVTGMQANARTDVDFSQYFEEGTSTIYATAAWGWFNVMLQDYDVMDYPYLYIEYESTCNFNLVLQNPNWQNAYSVTCNADATEAIIQVTPNAFSHYSCIVIQPHAEGEINIRKLFFCTEQEYFNPAPDTVEEALANLQKICNRYSVYLDKYIPGTGYGNYPYAFCEALRLALSEAQAAYAEGAEALTAEQYNALAQSVVDAWMAVTAAKILYLPEDGYYRFVNARRYQTGNEEEGYTYYTKALCSDYKGTNGWKNIDETDPSFIWTLEHKDGNQYVMANPSNHLYFSGSAENCSSDAGTIAIDPLVRDSLGNYGFTYPFSQEDTTVAVFNFRLSSDNADDYMYIHCNWHDNGNGWEGPLTKWCNTTHDSGASEFYLQPVDKEVALSILAENAYVNDFISMLADAKTKTAMANDMIKSKLITGASQFSSPYSQNDHGSRDGGDLSEGVLIDADVNTFWHSVWSDGNVEAGLHYLQIELPEPLYGDIELVISRRQTSSDHVTHWGIYGSRDSEGEKYDYEWIADVETPFENESEVRSATFQIAQNTEYRYLRFYAEATTSSRGYWHVSEFQLYGLISNPTNQAARMGDVYTHLQEAIEVAELVDQSAITKADYESLKAAYDPFIEKFVDPTPLRNAIASAEPLLALVEEGDGPGQWTFEAVEEFAILIENAKDYDADGYYTQEQSDAFLESLSDGFEKLMSLACTISPDKYYIISFASEEKYTEKGWNTNNVINSEFGPLFGTYLCPADASTLAITPADSLRQGSYMFFTSGEDASDDDLSFRFIPVDEDKYIIRHKTSGLYVHVYGYDSWTCLSLVPTLFTVNAIGHGECIIRGTDYAGNDMSCLHAQLSDHRLVTWHDTASGTNSGLVIEEAGDVAASEEGHPLMDMKAGEVTTLCYPLSVAPVTGTLYSVAGTYAADGNTYVALSTIHEAAPGQPTVYVAEGSYNAEADDDVVTVKLNVGTELATEPLNDGALQGVYSSIDLRQEVLVLSGDSCYINPADSTITIRSNHAYVMPGKVQADAFASYDLVIEVEGPATAIAPVLSTLSGHGKLYNAAGQLLRRDATLDDVRAMTPGLYIFNERKFLVK